MRLTRTTGWVGGTVAVCLLVTTAAWLTLISPRQEEAAGLREQTVAAASQNDALTAQVRALEIQLGDLPTTRAEVAALREQVPAEAALPQLLRQLSDVAERSGAEVTAVTPTEPTTDPAAVPTDTATTAPAADGDGGTPTAEPAESGDAAAATTPAATPVATVTVPVTVTADGTFSQIQELLRLVQVDLARAVLVRGVTLTTGEAGQLSMSLTAEVFVLPTTPQEEQLDAAAAATQAAVADDAGEAPTAAGAGTDLTPGSTPETTAPTGEPQ